MASSIEYFKTFTFEKHEKNEKFDFVTSHGDYDEWGTKNCVQLMEGMYKIGAEDVYNQALPSMFMGDVDNLEEKEIEEFKNKMITPKDALALFQEHDILEKAKEHAPGIVYYIEYLISKWEEGYYVMMFD